MSDPLKGAVDLSALSKPAPAEPGVYVCEVPDGCGLKLRGKHESVYDCLETCRAYVVMYFEFREKTNQILDEYDRMVLKSDALLQANQRLSADLDQVKTELANVKGNTVKKIAWEVT